MTPPIAVRTAAAVPPLQADPPKSQYGLLAPLAVAAAVLLIFGRKRVSPPVRLFGMVLAMAIVLVTLSYWLRPLLAVLGRR